MYFYTLQKALQKVYKITRTIDTQYIWDAEIRKCFDLKTHDWLLTNVSIPPKYRIILKGWLKAGLIEFNETKVSGIIE